MEDRRAIKTKKAIKKAFLEQLAKKPLNKITVAELSRDADLGRGTFYLHYNDVYDLFEQTENDTFSELIKIYEENINNLAEFIDVITRYIADNKDIFILLASSNTNMRTMRKLKKIFSKKVLQKEYGGRPTKYEEMEMIFFMSGCTGILEDWMEKGLKMPQKEVAKILHKILAQN